MLPHHPRALLGLTSLLLLALAACGCGSGDVVQTSDGGGVKLDCPASVQSGTWLLAFGPLTHQVSTGASAELSVIVTLGSQQEGKGKGAPGKTVTFKMITPGGDARLSSKTAQTDSDGLAKVTFTAGKQAMPYQVMASAPGTCPTTFSVDVRTPLRQLRAVTPSPLDTFTNSRVPIAVEATTDDNAPLSGEEITFKVSQGGTSETTFSAAAGGNESATLKVKTNASGGATVMLSTGSRTIAQLIVTASLQGTADADVMVRVSEGNSKGCQSDGDCPLNYSCKAGKCQPLPVTPAGGCTKDSDCTAPNVCDTVSGQCVSPTPAGGCKSDADCTSPNVCDKQSGKCLTPTGAKCDPIEGKGCQPGEICVGQECAKLPSGCTDNSACPTGFKCQSGKCVPQGKPPTGGCVTNADCPGGVCVNGVCKPKAQCTIPGKTADRLKGRWKYDSTLHLRQALSPFMSGFFKAAGYLRDIINGSFKISGVPSFIDSIVKKYLKKLVNQYVPPWGQQLASALGTINDLLSDMRVLATIQKTPAGNDRYLCSEQWDLIEFKLQGKTVSSPPSGIQGVGQVKVSGYTATEVCGVLYLQKHAIKNKVGGIIHWAINTALSLVTCNVQGAPCFNSVSQALQQVINCPMLGMQLDQLVQSVWSGAPSVASIVTQACSSEKSKLINQLTQALNDLSVKLSLLELSGTANIPAPGQDNQLSGGKWSGILGGGVAKGNFSGDFTAKRLP